MIEVKAPGKLYIAGEYAVLEYGHPAIIVALDKYITARIRKTNEIGTIYSSYNNNNPTYWTRFQGQATLTKRNSALRFVITSINVAEMYVLASGKSLTFFELNLTSSLDNEDGKNMVLVLVGLLQ